jgi:hypothetical protein
VAECRVCQQKPAEPESGGTPAEQDASQMLFGVANFDRQTIINNLVLA